MQSYQKSIPGTNPVNCVELPVWNSCVGLGGKKDVDQVKMIDKGSVVYCLCLIFPYGNAKT